MTDKHTPGPWEPKRIESQQWEIDAPNGDPLLGYRAWQGLAAVYGNDDNKVAGSQVAKANAHLIATAPAMLAVLKHYVMAFEKFAITNTDSSDMDHAGFLYESAQLAIKQATGDTE